MSKDNLKCPICNNDLTFSEVIKDELIKCMRCNSAVSLDEFTTHEDTEE